MFACLPLPYTDSIMFPPCARFARRMYLPRTAPLLKSRRRKNMRLDREDNTKILEIFIETGI